MIDKIKIDIVILIKGNRGTPKYKRNINNFNVPTKKV